MIEFIDTLLAGFQLRAHVAYLETEDHAHGRQSCRQRPWQRSSPAAALRRFRQPAISHVGDYARTQRARRFEPEGPPATRALTRAGRTRARAVQDCCAAVPQSPRPRRARARPGVGGGQLFSAFVDHSTSPNGRAGAACRAGSGLDGAEWLLQPRGDLALAQARKKSQFDGLALIGGQIGQRGTDAPRTLLAVKLLAGRCGRGCSTVSAVIAISSISRRRRVDARMRSMACYASGRRSSWSAIPVRHRTLDFCQSWRTHPAARPRPRAGRSGCAPRPPAAVVPHGRRTPGTRLDPPPGCDG